MGDLGDYCYELDRAIVPYFGVLSNSKPSRNTGNFMSELGKLLIILGIVLVVAGVLLTLLGRTNLPLGRLPGDILYRGKNTTFYFPLATCILLSVVLTVVLYIIGKFRR
jgi:peptidoglycan biosynthesis protein MviN/MurJ (putative lipid II flippase)